jgi:hypothetical protein
LKKPESDKPIFGTPMAFMQSENKEKDKSEEEVKPKHKSSESPEPDFQKIKAEKSKKKELNHEDSEESFLDDSVLDKHIASHLSKSYNADKKSDDLKYFDLIKSICNTKYFRGN